ncbi:MAG: hypothetical protein ACK4Q5_08375 [Saprospiraceae bacterium]
MFSIKSIRQTLPIAFAFAANALMAAPSILTPSSEIADLFATTPVTLRAGTSVTLTLNGSFSATDVAVGNALDFMVRNDVTVNGKVLIAAGSPAIGIVQKVSMGCNGTCLNMTIAVEGVQAVDGQTVNLNSIPHTINAPGSGFAAQANIGITVSARVRNDIKING